MSQRIANPFMSIFLLGALSACGGGGTLSGSNISGGFADLSNTAALPVTAVTLLPSENQTERQTGEIDYAASTVVLNGESGTFSDDRSEITLDNGALLDVAIAADRYAVRFDRLDPNGQPEFGLIGLATDPSAISNQGTARYNGQSELLVQTGTDVFELTADTEVNVDFALRFGVQARITNFEGTKYPNLGTQEDVSLPGEIRISEIMRDGAVLNGGEVELTGTSFPVSYQADFTLNGQFYGPDADDVGATFVIDDLGTTTTLILGDILVQE